MFTCDFFLFCFLIFFTAGTQPVFNPYVLTYPELQDVNYMSNFSTIMSSLYSDLDFILGWSNTGWISDFESWMENGNNDFYQSYPNIADRMSSEYSNTYSQYYLKNSTELAWAVHSFLSNDEYEDYYWQFSFDDENDPNQILACFVNIVYAQAGLFCILYFFCVFLKIFKTKTNNNNNKPFIDSLTEIWSNRETIYDEIASISEEFRDSTFFYNIRFQWGYFVHVVKKLAWQTIFYSSSGVFIILLIFVPVWMAIIVTLTVLLIDVNLWGWMYIVGVQINVISYLMLMTSVGLVVDYCVHIAVHFVSTIQESQALVEKQKELAKIRFKNDRNEEEMQRQLELNMKQAQNATRSAVSRVMVSMGSIVLKAAITTILGTMICIWTPNKSFREFFLTFVGVIMLAVLFALLFLPMVLFQFEMMKQCFCCNKKKRVNDVIGEQGFDPNVQKL